tara:strand:- start:229 stop:480 length:252 start_codon:yes stop_codon:yes gene_type:complete
VAPEFFKTRAFPQFFKHFRNFSYPDDEFPTSGSQFFSQLHERLGHEPKVAGIRILSLPVGRLEAIEAQDLSSLAGFVEWSVVA